MAFPYMGYPPQTESPAEVMSKSFVNAQQAMANRLSMQQQSEFLKTYPDLLQSQLNMQKTEEQYMGQMKEADLRNKLATAGLQEEELKWLPQVKSSDIAYKNAIGRASMDNATVAAINAQLAQSALPGQLSDIELKNNMQKMQNDLFTQFMSGNTVTPQNGQVSLPGFPATSTSVSLPEEVIKSSPLDYLPPKQEESIDMAELLFGSKYKTESQKAGEQAYASQEGRELSKGYNAYANETAEKADIAGKQSSVLTNLRASYGNIPDLNKGEVLGFLKDVPSESQLYESIKSGAVMEVLALQKGVQNENDRKAIEKTYGSRTMDDVTMDEILTIKEIENQRLIEKLDLVAPQVGEGRSRAEVEKAWQDYIKDNSIFDTETYQSFLKRKWESMDALSSIKDQERYWEFRKSMLGESE